MFLTNPRFALPSLGTFALVLLSCAAPAFAGILCYKQAVTGWTQTSPPGGGCSTYNNCPDRVLCVEGDVYSYAGTISFISHDCLTYSGGMWDPIKKVCVGGTKVSSQQSVNIFVQTCGGSCN